LVSRTGQTYKLEVERDRVLALIADHSILKHIDWVWSNWYGSQEQKRITFLLICTRAQPVDRF